MPTLSPHILLNAIDEIRQHQNECEVRGSELIDVEPEPGHLVRQADEARQAVQQGYPPRRRFVRQPDGRHYTPALITKDFYRDREGLDPR